MSSTFTSGRRRTGRIATLAIGAAVATTVSLMAPAATAATTPADRGLTVVGGSSKLSTDPADYKAGTYIVRFVDEPARLVRGRRRGLRGHQAGRRAPSSTPTRPPRRSTSRTWSRSRDDPGEGRGQARDRFTGRLQRRLDAPDLRSRPRSWPPPRASSRSPDAS